RFEVRYPEDFPDPKLAGKVYTYAIEIVANKEKKLPELNDEFAKDVSEAATLEELRGKIPQNLEAERDLRRTHQAHERILSKLIAARDFPVPEALIEQQMDVRLERAIQPHIHLLLDQSFRHGEIVCCDQLAKDALVRLV